MKTYEIDSRKIRGGEIFVALESEKADGHDFVERAIEAGASAAIVRADWIAPREDLPLIRVDDPLKYLQDAAAKWRQESGAFIIAVTGSVGKTTTSARIATALRAWKQTASTIGNFNNHIGLPLSLLAMKPGSKFGVFEIGTNHPGEIAALCKILRPDAAVITNVGPAHIEHFGSVEAIASEKAEVLRALPADGFAIVDGASDFADYFVKESAARVIKISAPTHGASPGESAARAFAEAVAKECGAPPEIISAALEKKVALPMRWEEKIVRGITWINDAYNANPVSMRAAIETFASIAPREKRVMVIGEMFELGADAPKYHAEIKAIAEKVGAREIIFVGKNFGTEETALTAAEKLRTLLRRGDFVLLKASRGVGLERTLAAWRRALARNPEKPAPEKIVPELAKASAEVVVLGAGASGNAAKALLESRGHNVVLLDKDEPFPADRTFDLCVVSPAIPMDHAWLAACKERGIPAISEMELGYAFWRGRILAVTGSKGKSTLVKLCAEALSAAGFLAHPSGNYGSPLCAECLAHGDELWTVAETSSFQLEHVRNFKPDCAVILNIQADHLDRHKTREVYAATKRRIFARQTAADLAIDAEAEFDESEKKLYAESWFDNPVLSKAAFSAARALRFCGLADEEISAAIANFKPLRHRMEHIAERGGVLFVDDSKATSLAATAAAMEMLARPVRLIAGGRLKENEFDFVKIVLSKWAKKVYLIGEAAQPLSDAWKDVVACEVSGDMASAVSHAAADAERGEAVLLSPGCASFDQFKSYSERGEVFARCVQQIYGEAN